MIISSDTLSWSDRDIVILDRITDFDLITESREASMEYFQWVRLANKGRLLSRIGWTSSFIPY